MYDFFFNQFSPLQRINSIINGATNKEDLGELLKRFNLHFELFLFTFLYCLFFLLLQLALE